MRPALHSGADGVLVVDKPRGITSHDVVARVRRILGTRRVGHVGTLDPVATGVLPLVVGRATRLASILSDGDKVYRSVFRLGVVTDTYDVTGSVATEVLRRSAAAPITLTMVQAMSRRFVGTFTQVPPPYSAKKIGGIRSYRLARRQQPIELKAVEVTVREFDIEGLADDRLSCRVTCTPGFYIRSLAHDLGQALGCGACLERLRRERSGAFGLDQAVTMDELERDHETGARHLIPMADLLPGLPSVIATERGSNLAAHGNLLTPAHYRRSTGANPVDTSPPPSAGAAAARVKIYDLSGALLAVAEGRPNGVLHPRIVLV